MKMYVSPNFKELSNIVDLRDAFTALDLGYMSRDPHHIWLWGAKVDGSGYFDDRAKR